MFSIAPLTTASSAFIQKKIDNKTKPLGALGALELLALQLALLTEQREKNKAAAWRTHQISINKPSMLIFAGDHGINEEKLSIAPSAVTQQMVLNFLHGGAAINCFCQSNDIALTVIDCGILQAINANDIADINSKATNNKAVNDTAMAVELIEQRLGAGTENFSVKAAMTGAQLAQGFAYGEKLVKDKVNQGVELLLLGEMGIANTSSASALMAALTSYSVEQCVGRGTGITDEQLVNKVAIITKALQRVADKSSSLPRVNQQEVTTILAELGGFEIVQMVAAILSAAAANIAIVIDGFIVSVAALVAVRLNKNVADYFIFAHVSQEKAHQLLLKELMAAQTFSDTKVQPLLSLGLCLGEGTGAALALPLIKAAASFYNNMASFESAGVTV
ncbi:nicotinate-nucleotide--dimethylbenzimidazole phosphoribosyltransferase [Colwellia ponticola]|uniref:Nicotinate-nucleotide--dimethylbenzimidazole phosphoribosyltransferase n=1 Tax=Colwellia ponticola TaxID=2304625 RepID=A0A8H2PMN4_9GAMM|nr:nicotinate-nucleotide--dimethylbenzimidazole phosphoribosyltransferase [Colwellia ponticola]TMM46849.1 nicotinate-nucleotide--dimethylbenzimidazole phosphoribosyltransferase [Colwellia ponticola]